MSVRYFQMRPISFKFLPRRDSPTFGPFARSLPPAMSSHTHGSSATHNGSLRKIRLWSDMKLVDWKLDLSQMKTESEIKALIAAQFGRAVGS